MDITLRYARADELDRVLELDSASFGIDYTDVDHADVALEIDPERVLAAVDGERFVGISAELPSTLSVPGGADVSALGITWVSVELTPRRRGVLRAMLDRQLPDGGGRHHRRRPHRRARAASTAATASGSPARSRRTVVDRRRAELARPVDISAVQRLTHRGRPNLLPGLHDRWRAVNPGAFGIATRGGATTCSTARTSGAAAPR